MTKHIFDLEMLDYKALSHEANQLRGQVIDMSARTGAAHLASCLSCCDILTCLYGLILRIDPKKPKDPDRDRFILSKGHAAAALYAVLAKAGFFPTERLEDFCRNGSLFAEHPLANGLPGVEAATGSLGHGLPIACGLALSAKISGRNYRVFALLSDGENNEGSVWEAAMFAPAQKLSNLTVIVDYNKWQATARSNETLSLSPLLDKWVAFGWRSFEINGHDMGTLAKHLSCSPDSQGRPTAIIAHTIKGKGVSFMEDDNNWHYRVPKEEEVRKAYQELGLV